MPACVIAGDVRVGDSSTLAATPASGVDRLGQAEVEHLHRAVGADLDVGRLQVPMDDALLVRGLERLGNLPRDRQRLVTESARARCRSASVSPSTSSMTSARSRPLSSRP